MLVRIRSIDSDTLDVGRFDEYGEALSAAIVTLRELEAQPRNNHHRWVDILDGDELMFSAEVSVSAKRAGELDEFWDKRKPG